jgi:DNA-binding transcriptional LysR family regulator
MLNRFDGIDLFLQVVESGSFARAAERLHLSRSAVGKSIARLESRLGVRLFLRTTRSQTLTAEGSLLLEHAHRAHSEMEAAQALLESGKQILRGKLRVSLPVLFGRRCVAPVLLELAREHPELVLELSFSDRVINLVDEGFDFAVRNGQLEDSTDLIARPLSWHDMRLCAAPSYLARYGTPASPDELMQHQAIFYLNKTRPLEWQLTINGQIERFKPEGRFYMDDLDAIADAAEAGDGIAWLPYWLINERLHSGRLVQILPDTAGVRLPIHAVWPKTRWLPLKVRMAVDRLREQLPQRIALKD